MRSHLTKTPSNGGLSPLRKSVSNQERIILHVDMNSFFASVEQACDPRLRGRPVFVCGEGRTVVVTASYEARSYGIKTGMSRSEALRLCPCAIPVIGNYTKYEDASARIRDMLKKYTDRLEMFSIDEAFLDLTDAVETPEAAVSAANDIKSRIRSRLGLTCSIGIAPNKLLAKLASEMKKPDGLVNITRGDIPALYENLPVEKFCGIGSKTKKKLAMLGIRTAKQLGEADIGILNNYFGFLGYFLKNIGLGIDNSEVGFYYESGPQKSFGHSYTMQKDTADERAVKSCLFWLAEKVGRRMRKAGCEGFIIHFYMRYADFTGVSKQSALKTGISRGYDIYQGALKIMRYFVPFKKPVRLLGVSVGGIKPGPSQMFLLDGERKYQDCQSVADSINDLYGENSLKPLFILRRPE